MMNPEVYFSNLRKHVDQAGAISILERAALDAWDAGNQHEASYFLSAQDLVSSGGLADATSQVPEIARRCNGLNFRAIASLLEGYGYDDPDYTLNKLRELDDLVRAWRIRR